MSKTKAARPSGQVHGVLLVDKPSGMTSFDVVAQARRAFGTRKVGHAGTLDPMATGVLVILLGEATKLSNVLSTDKKAYKTKVALGATTDTLDKDGKVTRQVPPLPELSVDQVEAVLCEERKRKAQMPPQVSAIKVNGKKAYEEARKGNHVDLVPRHVVVHELSLLAHSTREVELEMLVSKGYYVRSLGRDLALALGTVGHLTELRRTQSGPFLEREAHPLPLTADLPLLSLEAAARRCLPVLHVTEEGAVCVGQGKHLTRNQILTLDLPLSAADSELEEPTWTTYAVFFSGSMIALVDPVDGAEFKVRRGIGAAECGAAVLQK